MTFDIWGEAGGVGWVGGNWTEEDGLSGFYVFTSTSHKEFWNLNTKARTQRDKTGKTLNQPKWFPYIFSAEFYIGELFSHSTTPNFSELG